jgi:hypothetical protein
VRHGNRLLDRGYTTFRGSMPNFFIREISVVRLMSMRAAEQFVGMLDLM